MSAPASRTSLVSTATNSPGSTSNDRFFRPACVALRTDRRAAASRGSGREDGGVAGRGAQDASDAVGRRPGLGYPTRHDRQQRERFDEELGEADHGDQLAHRHRTADREVGRDHGHRHRGECPGRRRSARVDALDARGTQRRGQRATARDTVARGRVGLRADSLQRPLSADEVGGQGRRAADLGLLVLDPARDHRSRQLQAEHHDWHTDQDHQPQR